MSSTKDAKMRERIGALFDDVLMPIAERQRASGAPPFPLEPDVSRLSYYARRAQCSMTHDDFTAPSCVDFDDFEDRLAAHWQALGRHELADEAARFAVAARAAHAVHALEQQDAEVSPYVYAMF